MRGTASAIGLARIGVALSAVSLLVSLSGVSPAQAVRAVKRALNADAVDGISASRKPTPGKLVPLGSNGHFPAGVIATGTRGPRGADGPAGQTGAAGNAGAQGPPGLSNIRVTNGSPVNLSQNGGTATQVARIDNLPAGSWLLAWSATLDYGAGQNIDTACHLQAGQATMADADVATGNAVGAQYADEMTSFGATTQPQTFSVQLLCNPGPSTTSPIHVDSQRIVAIRADTLDVTG
jgi:hypothetical protein